MANRSPPRIDWAPDDRSLVSCVGGVVNAHDLASARARAAIYTREVAVHDILDARFMPDGRILGIDHRGTLVWHANGELVAQRHMSEPRRPHAAAIDAEGTRFVVLGPGMRAMASGPRKATTEIYVMTTEGERVWTLNPNAHDIALTETGATATLSGDGSVVAIGFTTASRRHDFAVIDLASDAIYDRGVARAPGAAPASGHVVVALDAMGDRFALAAPGTGAQLGVIRVGRDGDGRAVNPTDDDELEHGVPVLRVRGDESDIGAVRGGDVIDDVDRGGDPRGDAPRGGAPRGGDPRGGDIRGEARRATIRETRSREARDIVTYARNHPAGAMCVAIDRSGALAAFGYAAPPDGARGRLRVEYLSPVPATASTIAVLDSLSIEPALPDLIAVAFSHDSRQLACLASTGAIEIVPVP